MAEGIDESGIQETINPFAFDRHKTRYFAILFGPRQIDFVVGCIDIAADNDVLALSLKSCDDR